MIAAVTALPLDVDTLEEQLISYTLCPDTGCDEFWLSLIDNTIANFENSVQIMETISNEENLPYYDENGDNYIIYAFTSKEGFSKFGSYEGNGNANGSFVYTGFAPALVITKSVDSTSSWHIFDNLREGYNVDNDPLIVEATTAEATTDMVDLLSNGFKFRISSDPNVAETYIFLAWAKNPFKYTTAR